MYNQPNISEVHKKQQTGAKLNRDQEAKQQKRQQFEREVKDLGRQREIQRSICHSNLNQI